MIKKWFSRFFAPGIEKTKTLIRHVWRPGGLLIIFLWSPMISFVTILLYLSSIWIYILMIFLIDVYHGCWQAGETNQALNGTCNVSTSSFRKRLYVQVDACEDKWASLHVLKSRVFVFIILALVIALNIILRIAVYGTTTPEAYDPREHSTLCVLLLPKYTCTMPDRTRRSWN